jgi:hypothetical protein
VPVRVHLRPRRPAKDDLNRRCNEPMDDAEHRASFALGVIPTRHYGANSAWQQFSILPPKLIRSFQPDTIAPCID